MAIPTHVDGISACSPDDHPLGFELDGSYYRIYAVEADWYRPSGHFFKVRADGKRFIIRHNIIEDEWALLSVFDGAELFKRDGVEIVTVDPAIVRAAVKNIESCEHLPSG